MLERLGLNFASHNLTILFCEHRLQTLKIGNSVTTQASMKPRTRDLGIDKFTDHSQQIIKGQQQYGASFHRDPFLCRAHGAHGWSWA